MILDKLCMLLLIHSLKADEQHVATVRQKLANREVMRQIEVRVRKLQNQTEEEFFLRWLGWRCPAPEKLTAAVQKEQNITKCVNSTENDLVMLAVGVVEQTRVIMEEVVFELQQNAFNETKAQMHSLVTDTINNLRAQLHHKMDEWSYHHAQNTSPPKLVQLPQIHKLVWVLVTQVLTLALWSIGSYKCSAKRSQSIQRKLQRALSQGVPMCRLSDLRSLIDEEHLILGHIPTMGKGRSKQSIVNDIESALQPKTRVVFPSAFWILHFGAAIATCVCVSIVM